MDFVKHKLFGVGEVVSRKGNCLIVKFEDNSEKKFAIPQSFQLGILTAEGDLKKEVDDAIKAKEELAQKRESEQMLEKAKIERIKKSPKKEYQKENIAFKDFINCRSSCYFADDCLFAIFYFILINRIVID